MAEKIFPVQMYGVDLLCDECVVGTMAYVGMNVQLIDELPFVHRCHNCAHEMYTAEKYPAIRYRRIEDEMDPSATL